MFEGTPQCMRSFPKTTLEGFWILGFETSYFTPSIVADLSSVDLSKEGIWIEVDDHASPKIRSLTTAEPTIFRVKLEVRYKRVPGSYGHRGASRFGALLLRPIDMEAINANR